MLSVRNAIFSLAMVTTLTAPTFSAQRLGYRLRAGDVYCTQVQTVVDVPVLGEQIVETEYDFTCNKVSGDVYKMGMAIAPMSSPSGSIPQLAGTFDLRSDGMCSGIASADWFVADAKPLLANAAMLFIELPDGSVQEDTSWQGLVIMHMPPQNMAAGMALYGLGMSKSVKLQATYTYRGLASYQGYTQKLAKVDITMRSVEGQNGVVELDGTGYLDRANSLCLGSEVKGFIKVTKLGVPVTVPLTIITGSVR